MSILKRIALFVIVNIAVMITFTLVMALLEGFGVKLSGSLVFDAVVAVIVGFSGAFISLLISKWVAKTFMGVKVLNPGANLNGYDRWLLDTVHAQARAAGLKKMPEVGVYDSPEVNAFATGPSKSNSLVAFSSGLLSQMSQDEVEAVSAHEVGHIANGDMVTQTLIQGVINTFVVFFARIIARVAASAVREEMAFLVFIVVNIVLQIVFGILGSLVVNAFSRYREYQADAFAGRIAGRDKMIAALRALQRNSQAIDTRHPAMATMKISNHPGWALLTSTHPPLEKRIEALQRGQ
ncbi:MAG TPA: protease HtpX [Fimbriimonadaceae bacterium]|nr:protease HtpX [Armatimonadota bacterium]HCM72736.1 protease HtpX [Armatimonadota bacterium]HRD31126.1 protease HtpX [Fimbriimonadaceae bacterium]HRE93516.1 protease HtpX [Fimbriimonadaceae bacterium]HRI74907.1 protease HtpX [Fimbriimonadaceae bacterium]